MMKYDEIAELCEELDYRNKLRLAQLLIQLARKEEENQNPKKRTAQKKGNASEIKNISDNNVGTIEYVAQRLLKSKPVKRKSLEHFVSSMFQFQGGISEPDKMKIISELQRLNYIKIDSNNRVTYLSIK